MISKRYFETFYNGMPAQLQELTLAESIEYVRNHIHSFVLDENICFCFIERLANDPDIGKSPEGSRALIYLLNKSLQLRPFRPGLLGLVSTILNEPAVRERMEIVEKLNDKKETYELINELNLNSDGEDAQKFVHQLIEQHPMHVAGAQLALSIDRYFGQKPGPWLDLFKCPKTLQKEWDIVLFNHYAAMGHYDEAMELWERLDGDKIREVSYNLAAEMFVAAGEVPKGLLMYAKSLRLDPRQTPVRLRVRELENPFQPNAALVDEKKVNICLYSWNKAEMLGQTLESLSQSEIGKARIDVLLNGCTDNSHAVVESYRDRFPNNEFVIHNLHVNIGAPAARNWLMFHPDVQRSEYIAFLDDDVTVQPDWLSHFLTIADQDKKIGVVGCKTVHPGSPRLFQYLYRYVAIADYGLLKMSIDSPIRQFDNHLYDVIRECRNVMGCQHLLRTSAINTIPAGFDIRFSPSQVDDIDHDLCVCLEGYKVMYTGLVTCVHHQSSGTNAKKKGMNFSQIGSILGNDLKLFAKHCGHLPKLKRLDNVSLDLGVDVPVF